MPLGKSFFRCNLPPVSLSQTHKWTQDRKHLARDAITLVGTKNVQPSRKDTILKTGTEDKHLFLISVVIITFLSSVLTLIQLTFSSFPSLQPIIFQAKFLKNIHACNYHTVAYPKEVEVLCLKMTINIIVMGCF